MNFENRSRINVHFVDVVSTISKPVEFYLKNFYFV